MAKYPATFFVRIRMQIYSDLGLEDIRLENAETNENLLVVNKYNKVLLISRFPKEANGAKWIQANEQEILEFGDASHDRTIYLDLNR
jgi:hypothetical protein